jgi:hypothetical protein
MISLAPAYTRIDLSFHTMKILQFPPATHLKMPTAPIPEALEADFAILDVARITIRDFIINTEESY